MLYQPKSLLLTGAAGFIGSNYLRRLVKHYPDLKIISLDKLTYAGSVENFAGIKNDQHHFVQGDICDGALVTKLLLEHQVDTIVHFAAESHVDNSIENPGIFLQTNIIGTYTLLECARKFWIDEKQWDEYQCRFHHVSTDEVYGSLDILEPAFEETRRYQPNSPYSASKASSDHFARAYFHTYQLPITISNCSNNFGPFQHREKLIPKVIEACINQNPIPVYGNGKNIRDWLYVEDHCEAIDKIIQHGRIGEVYNIGGKNELDNISLVKEICRIMDHYFPVNAAHEKLITFTEDRKGHDKRYAINNSKIEKELDWKPKGQFIENLNDTIKFYIREFEKEQNKLIKATEIMVK